MSSVGSISLLDPDHLARRVTDCFRQSGASGSRRPIAYREEIVEDDGVAFVVRVLSGGAPRRTGRPERSPFLPPHEPDLLVGALSPTHLCLLNKYNVLDRHVLIVTRDFENQEKALTRGDLEAASMALQGLDGLVFYNSGKVAGASQSHKHLQLVPFPLGPGAERFPLERSILAALEARSDRLPMFDFRHALAPERSFETYRRLVARFDLEREERQMAPYNLLMTRSWMLVVPRESGLCGPIDVNALGFAGALVARGEESLAFVRAEGPRNILRQVAAPW